MSLNDADIKKIAKLAHIKLDEDEVSKFRDDLSDILKWAEMLKNTNTDQAEETTSVANQTLILREDKVTEGNIADDLMKNAPDSKYNCYIVPKVIEQ